MWKLKIAEGEGPYFYSTNNYVGRQIWEYQPDAGTPEEHPAIDEARRAWKDNRNNLGFHCSADLFARMQLKKENGIDLLRMGAVRVGEEEEMTYENVSIGVRKAVRLHRAIQASDGHWPAENFGPMFFTPPLEKSIYSHDLEILCDE